LRGLSEHPVGRRLASPLVTPYSDPSLPGYGHYAYDHEGTPAQRVVHIDRGVFRGFMNSRQTAAIFGGEPNGHWKGTRASLVPLIRMSNTVFDAGRRAPEDILKEVDHGWYVAGHRMPSIAESREVFAAANTALLTRLNYTSHIPSNGVEEPKSTASCGLGIRVAFVGSAGPLVGFGSEPSDLGVTGARRALDRARASAVADPNFVSLPR